MGASTVIVHACMDPLHMSLPTLLSTSGHMQALSHGWSRVPYGYSLCCSRPPSPLLSGKLHVAIDSESSWTTTYHWSWIESEYIVYDCGDARSTRSKLI